MNLRDRRELERTIRLRDLFHLVAFVGWTEKSALIKMIESIRWLGIDRCMGLKKGMRR